MPVLAPYGDNRVPKTLVLLALLAFQIWSLPIAAEDSVQPSGSAVIRSIRNWVVCDGRTDDAVGAATAFFAAKHHAFILLVYCPVFIHTGTDVARPIFVDSGTTVYFTRDGL